MKINQLLHLMLFLVFVSCQKAKHEQTPDPGFSPERLQRYEAFLQNEIDEGRIPGAVSLIVRRGQTVHNVSLGTRNVETGEKMAVDDIFFIQSMTKPIITVAFMMLYEEGHFLLNDPVTKYLPQFRDRVVTLDRNTGENGPTEPANKEITIAHLLSHTAGLSHGLGPSQLDRDYLDAMYNEEHQTVEDRVNRMLDLPLIGHPGEQWYYSASPDVLSVLIAQFSGMSTEEFLKKRLFDPLGMKNTGYNIPESEHHRVVKLHRVDSTNSLVKVEVGGLGGNQLTGNTIHSGVNALFSTPEDYATFCQMLINNGKLNGKRYLSRKTIELMTVNHVDQLFSQDGGYGFGLGFSVLTDLADSKDLISEGTYAWGGAYCTYFFIDPKEELVAVLMTQLEPYSGYYNQKMSQFIYQAIDD